MDMFQPSDILVKTKIRLGVCGGWWCFLTCFYAVVLSVPAWSVGVPANTNALSLVELQKAISEHGRLIRSFRLEGTICAVAPEQNIIVLQDQSSTALLEVPDSPATLKIGDRISIEGDHCMFVRSRFGIRLGSTLILDNKSTPGHVISGSVFLTAGLNPIHLKWFRLPARESENEEILSGHKIRVGVDWIQAPTNGSALTLEYEGPNIPLQILPSSLLWQKQSQTNQSGSLQGLHFTAFRARNLGSASSFEDAEKVGEGIATNIDLVPLSQLENTGVIFDGYLQITNAGVYTFQLSSDDGSVLHLSSDSSSSSRTVVLEHGAAPSPQNLGQTFKAQSGNGWVSMKGEVTFAGYDADGLQLDLMSQSVRAQITVIDESSLMPASLVHQRIEVLGICEQVDNNSVGTGVRIVVPSSQQIKILRPFENVGGQASLSGKILTSAIQVRRLRPEEAKKGFPATLQGVVIWTSMWGFTLQDSTGGVFIHFNPDDEADEPRVGDIFKVEGTSAPGDFSPVILASEATLIGMGNLPEPILPTWDQLMNGSLDAEYVEIHGVITSMTQTEMTILTPDGKLTILADNSVNYPLPPLPTLIGTTGGKVESKSPSSFVGSIIRIRGCLTAIWDRRSQLVLGGFIHLAPAVVQVERMAPSEPYDLPTTKITDLQRFNSRASALQMTKVGGQIVYAGRREAYIMDEGIGIRVPVEDQRPFSPGDLVEAVGFPFLGGPSPVLEGADIRKTGHAPLPSPLPIPAEELLNRNYDSTLVQLKATLVNDTIRLDERVLELQVGPVQFLARLKLDRRPPVFFAPGSILRLTGVYVSTRQDQVGSDVGPFELFLNDAADVVVLQRPSWWTVRHAVTLAAILACGLSLAFIWITVLHRKVEARTEQLREEISSRQKVEHNRLLEQERSRVARDLHDELGAGLTEVGILGTLAKNPLIRSEEKVQYLDQITKSANALVTGLDEIVWAINPHYDSVDSLATYYSLFAQRFLNMAGIACRLGVAENLSEYPLNSKTRHGIFLAFKEALNNIIRHSGASEAEIRIGVNENQLVITIHDNGRGFDYTVNSPGNDGLRGMRQRLQELGGTCLIESFAARGTLVRFLVPLNEVAASSTEPTGWQE